MEQHIEIPFHLLSEDALKGLIEEFVSREGTDYGQSDYTLERKASSVRSLLEKGRAIIVYDPSTGGCNIVLREDLKRA